MKKLFETEKRRFFAVVGTLYAIMTFASVLVLLGMPLFNVVLFIAPLAIVMWYGTLWIAQVDGSEGKGSWF